MVGIFVVILVILFLIYICLSFELDNFERIIVIVGVTMIFFSILLGESINANKSINIEKECQKNHISYTLVDTISEYTEIDKKQIYYFLLTVSDDEMDLGDAIHYLDKDLSDKEIDAILTASALKEKKGEK